MDTVRAIRRTTVEERDVAGERRAWSSVVSVVDDGVVDNAASPAPAPGRTRPADVVKAYVALINTFEGGAGATIVELKE